MTKIAILCNINIDIRCDFYELNNLADQFILITSANKVADMTAHQKHFFNIIHETTELSSAEYIIQHYVNEYGAQQCLLLCFDELILLSVAKFRQQFEIAGPKVDTINRFIDKTIMKKIVEERGLRVPMHAKFNRDDYQQNPQTYLKQIADNLHYPMIAKPVNMAGSHSLTIIESPEQLRQWAQHAQALPLTFEIDEYISGKLYHCDSIVQNGKILFTIIYEYFWPCGFYGLGKALGSIPLSPQNPLHAKLDDFTQRTLAALQAPDGTTHMEIFVSHENELIFLEVGARPPGGGIIFNTESITGINYQLEHLKLQLGAAVNISPRTDLGYRFWCYIPKPQGKLKQRHLPSLLSAYKVEWMVALDEQLQASQMGDNTVIFREATIAAKLSVHNSDYNTLYQDFEALRKGNFFVTE